MPHVQSSSPHTIIRCGPPLSMHARERASMADWLYVDLNPFTTSFFEGRGEGGVRGRRAARMYLVEMRSAGGTRCALGGRVVHVVT